MLLCLSYFMMAHMDQLPSAGCRSAGCRSATMMIASDKPPAYQAVFMRNWEVNQSVVCIFLFAKVASAVSLSCCSCNKFSEQQAGRPLEY